MKSFALFLFLVAGSALAQHDGMVMPKVLPPGAEETGDHMGNHGPLSTTNGASPSGAAWLVPSVSGLYTLHNGAIKGEKYPLQITLQAGKPVYIMPHPGPLIWTPPGGVRSVVPDDNLIPIKNSYP